MAGPMKLTHIDREVLHFAWGIALLLLVKRKDRNNGLFVSFVYGVGVPWIAAVYAENCGVDTAAHAINSAPLDNDRQRRRRRRYIIQTNNVLATRPPGTLLFHKQHPLRHNLYRHEHNPAPGGCDRRVRSRPPRLCHHLHQRLLAASRLYTIRCLRIRENPKPLRLARSCNTPSRARGQDSP